MEWHTENQWKCIKTSTPGLQIIGSKIVKERIQLLNQMGYQITIQSLDRLPQGTTIEMTFKE